MKNPIPKLKANFINSLRGLKIAFKEHSFVLEVLTAPVFLYCLLLPDKPVYLKIALLIAYFLMLAAELLNTAIERLCDRVTTNYDDLIRDVKDLSSAGVFMTVILNIILMTLFWVY